MLVGIIVASIIVFQKRFKETKKLMANAEYNTYDNYYVIITDNRDTDYWQSIYEGALEEAAKSNSYVELMGNNIEDDISKEDMIRIAINSDVSGIIIEADESYRTVNLLKEADAKGIPVVTVSEDNVETKRKSFIGVSGYNLGKVYGEEICKYVREKNMPKCNVMVLIDEDLANGTQSIISTAIREQVEDEDMSKRIEITNRAINNEKEYSAEEEIRDIFVGQDDIPDVIVCLSEKNTLCVEQTVVDYTKVGEVEIFGYYTSPTIENAIDKNIIRSTIVIDTKQMGRYSVAALDEYRESGYVSELYFIDVSLVTAEDVSADSGEGGQTDEE
jgi:ribose transport system substrate-binding protein